MRQASTADLELCVLGPLRLRRDVQPVALVTRKTQALLLILALDGGAARPRLCALLWPDLNEGAARRNLRRELARLRAAGGVDAVRAEGDHLSLGATLSCDLQQAEAALARAAPDEALEFWRGDLADGLALDDAPAFAPWLVAARERALRLRLRALEASAAAAQARGDAAGALDRVLSLLALDELQERHHRSAMRLLAAAGERAAALRQFERCQDLLATELGLQPMPETVALAQALRGALEPAPMASMPASTTGAWPAELPLVGRAAEVASMQRAWSRGQALVLVGEAGIGKTRLATDFAASMGPFALVRCQAGDSELTFGAFARALRVLAGEPPDLRELEPWIVAELTRLLPELGAAPAALRTEAERLRFDEACMQAWAALSRGDFDAVVLDDWQLADPASRTLLARAAARRREAGAGGAIELLTWRGAPEEPGLHALAEALKAETVALGPLPAQAVYDLVRQLSGAADPARFGERLRGATGGHPYFIAETLRDLAERSLLQLDKQGRWRTPFDEQTDDYSELPLPASVRDAVLARVQRLDVSSARLLEAAALAREPFGATWLASACALSELEAVQALEQCAQAQLMRARDEGGYAWVHDLARRALDSALTPTRRRLLHHRLALAAEALSEPARAARHFEACGEPRRAVPHRLAAGDAARALVALHEAVHHWQQGMASAPPPAQAGALLTRLLEAEYTLGRRADAALSRQRLQALLESGVLPADAAAEAGHALVHYLTREDSADAALALLAQLAPAGDTVSQLRRLTLHIDALHQRGRIAEARALGETALALAPAAGRERAELLASLALLEFAAGHTDASIDLIERCLTAARQQGDDLLVVRGLYFRGAFLAESGDLTAAETSLREAATLAGRFGNRPTQLLALYNLAAVHSQQTRPDAALAAAEEGWALCRDQPAGETKAMFRALFVDAHYVRGDWGAAWAHVEPAIEEVLTIGQPMSTAGVAMAVLEPMAVLGQWPRAARLLAALEDEALAQAAQAMHEVWLACALAALLRGDAAEAGSWLARLGAPESIENPRVRQRWMLLEAQRRLQRGDGTSALAGLPADDAPGMNDELRLRVLALRCQAGTNPAWRALGLATLAGTLPHAAAALQLAQAFGGVPLAEQVERRAAGLADWPAVHASFRAVWQR